jgi:hypothetical protein
MPVHGNLAKPVRIRSKALTDSAKGQKCTLRWRCNSLNWETVVFCHARAIGDGVATKPPDFWGYYGCHYCHIAEERGLVPSVDIMRAIRETQTIMARDGLISIKGWKP